MPELTRFDWERKAIAERFNGEALRVLWAYASFSDSATLLTFPTIRQVSEATGVSVEKVGKYRKALLEAGWLAESEEKTSRGNAKLMLAVGEPVQEKSYLGEKKAMNPRSMDNLIPAAKQKKAAASLDTPDKAGLEHREGTGLEHRDIQALDTPDVTTSELNNHYLSTNNNHASASAAAPVLEKGNEMNDYGHSCLREDYEVTNLEGVTYFLNSEGVTKVDAPKKKSFTPKVIGGTRKVDMSFFVTRTRNAKDKELVKAAEKFYADPDFHSTEQPVGRYIKSLAAGREELGRVSA